MALLAILLWRLIFSGKTMWCSNCHQDVPGVAHATSGRTVCSRCQQPFRTTKPAYAAKICDEGLPLDEPIAALAAAAPPLGGFDWQTRKTVRHLSRELRRPTVSSLSSTGPIQPGSRRLHPPENLFHDLEAATAPAFAPITTESSPIFATRTRHAEASQIFAWLVVIAGMLALAGGLGLVGWSLSSAQMRYWNLALGLTLGGQGLLIFGLVLVVTRIWRNSRYASNKLQDVHARLAQVQHTADALTATRPGGAPAFYADLVRGASPQVLLANLKGQVDQLATRLGSGW